MFHKFFYYTLILKINQYIFECLLVLCEQMLYNIADLTLYKG